MKNYEEFVISATFIAKYLYSKYALLLHIQIARQKRL